MVRRCLVSLFDTWWPKSMVNFLYILFCHALFCHALGQGMWRFSILISMLQWDVCVLDWVASKNLAAIL